MEIVNFGHFVAGNDGGILIFTNEDGQDWYELRRGLTSWDDKGGFINAVYGAWALVDPDTFLVTSVEYDPSRLMPGNRLVLGIDADWQDIKTGMLYQAGDLVILPEPPIPEPVTVVYAVHLWERLTSDEADQVGATMSEQPFRTRKIFESANSFRSDHELWPLLQQIANNLFGAVRAAQILAPSTDT